MEGPVRNYIGSTATTFKARFGNHKASMTQDKGLSEEFFYPNSLKRCFWYLGLNWDTAERTSNRPSVPRKFWISSLLVILWKTYFQSRKESRTCAHRRVHVRVSFWLCFPLLRYCRTGCGLFRPKIGPLRHGAQACQPSSPQAPCGSSVRPFCIVPEAAMDEAF